jgi:integrase
MTIRDELVEHLTGEEGLAPRTVTIYAAVYDRLVRQADARGLDLVTLDARQTRELADLWPFSVSTRYQLRATLMHLWACQGRLDGPLRAVRVPRRARARCRALSPAEAAVLAAAAEARGDRAGLAVSVGLYQALRRAEIAAMRWEDLLPDGWLRVMGKGDVERVIPLHPRLRDRLTADPRCSRRRSPWVFPGRRWGDHVVPATVWEWACRVAREAGLRAAPPHILRHTALATANDATGDLRAVQDLAGHSKPETTAAYTRARESRLIAAMRAISYEEEQLNAT